MVEICVIGVEKVKSSEFALLRESNQGLDATNLGICRPRHAKRLWMRQSQSLYYCESSFMDASTLCSVSSRDIYRGKAKNDHKSMQHNLPLSFLPPPNLRFIRKYSTGKSRQIVKYALRSAIKPKEL